MTVGATESFERLRAKVIEVGAESIEPKRAYKPRAKKEPEPEPIQIIDPEVITECFAFLFDSLADRRGAHWKMTPDETKRLGELTNRVIGKHAPEWLAKWGDEIALATLLGYAVGTRLMIDAKLKKDIDDAVNADGPLTPQ